MPNTIHPLLMEDANKEAAPVQEEAATLEENLAALSEPEPVPVAEPTPAEEEFYRINRSSLYKELARLEQEDPDFRNVLNSFVGRKAAREYKPKIVELEAKLAEQEAARQAQFRKALEAERAEDPEGFAQKVVTDPRYRQALDAKPVNPREVEARGQFELAIETALDSVAPVITPGELDQFRRAVMSGWYDVERDQQGNPSGRKLSPAESLSRFQSHLYQYAMQNQQAAPKAPEPKPVPAPAPAPVAEVEKPKPNVALAQASPDLTPQSSGVGGGKRKYKMSEVRAMTREEKGRIWPGLNDFGRAYAAGEIELD